MNKSDYDKTEDDIDFGSVLADVRKSKDYTVEDISRQLKIPVQAITAIENNDVAVLPAPIYTQGYIRAYAKFLEIHEDVVLDMYSRAVPHDPIAKLKSRSTLPDEANSQSPLVKFVTILLVLAGIAAVIYGSYQYYQEKADVMETELESKERSFTGSSLDFPGTHGVDIKQEAELVDDELVVQRIESIAVMNEAEIDDNQVQLSSEGESAADDEPLIASETVVDSDAASLLPEDSSEISVQQDTLVIHAKKGSWVKVIDDTNKRLFHNMIGKGGSKTFVGQAPFRVTLGNASTTSVTVNGLEIDLADVIRAKNTAVFSVSTENQKIIIH